MSITERVKRIVAVDDSNVVLKMIKNVLDKDQYDLHPFSTGKRALEYLMPKDHIPDLIILDIEMPEMNGYDVLERIKKMDHLKDVPVIFLTANSEKKQVIKAVSGGVKDYVIKPIDKDVLIKKLNALFHNQRGNQAGNQTADNQTTDNQAADNQAADNQTTDNQAADNQTVDNQAADNQTVDNQTVDNQAADNQTADGKESGEA